MNVTSKKPRLLSMSLPTTLPTDGSLISAVSWPIVNVSVSARLPMPFERKASAVKPTLTVPGLKLPVK